MASESCRKYAVINCLVHCMTICLIEFSNEAFLAHSSD